MSTDEKFPPPEEPMEWMETCRECGTTVMAFHKFVGLLPQEALGDEGYAHHKLVCSLHQTLRAMETLRVASADLAALIEFHFPPKSVLPAARRVKDALDAVEAVYGKLPLPKDGE